MPEYKLPDVGEGLTEAEIVTWKVKVGDAIAVNDIVVEIETAKSLVELPSPYAGTVTALLVPEGETVPVGTPIIAIGDASRGAGRRPRRPHPRPPRRRSTSPTPPPAAAARARAWSAATRPSATRCGGRARRTSPAAAAAQHTPPSRSPASFVPGEAQSAPEVVEADEPAVPAYTPDAPRPPVQRRRAGARQAAGPQAGQGPRRRPHARSSDPARAGSSPATTSRPLPRAGTSIRIGRQRDHFV